MRHVQTDSARPAVGISLLYAHQLPQHICIREIVIAPTTQKE